MLKQSQQQYSFILPTWKNHEKSIKILQISSKKLESEKGMSWTIGSPNGGATGGGPSIGCIGWKGLAEAQFTILPIFGERKSVSSTRCFWDFWKFLLFFFGIFLLKLLHFRCVAFLVLFIGSFSLIFRTRWYNSGLSDGSPLGGKASPWRFGKRKSHLRISRKEPKQLTWRAGWERERLILSFIAAKLSCPLLDFVSSPMRIFWDPSKAWFICFGIFQVDLGVLWHDLPCFHVSSSPVLIWMRSEPASCVWPSDILWAYDEFPCSHLCITFLLEGLSVYPVCSIFEESGGQPESSPITSSTKWPLTKMTSCSNIEVGAQLHTNLRRFIDQSAVRTFRISKETIKVKATFYTVNNHTWHCDILYHHLRMISNACLNWLHLYLLGKTNSICTMCTWIDILEANMITWLELFKLFM